MLNRYFVAYDKACSGACHAAANGASGATRGAHLTDSLALARRSSGQESDEGFVLVLALFALRAVAFGSRRQRAMSLLSSPWRAEFR